MPAYEAAAAEFSRYDAQVLGISCDSVHCHRAWARSMGGIESFPLLSDFWPHGITAQKYGVFRAEGYPDRALFVIDKQGRVVYIDVHDIDEQPDESVLLDVLRRLG